jgi:hypothetical protein
MADIHPFDKITDWPTNLLEMYGARGQIGTIQAVTTVKVHNTEP